MAKVHLSATVPNEGAWRLVWFLGETRGDDELRPSGKAGRAALARHGITADVIDRLVAGELEPGAAMAYSIFSATGEQVRSGDWRRPAAGGWFDRPAGRAVQSPTFRKAA